MPLSELKSKYRKISSLEKAQSGWEEEYEVSSKQVYFFKLLFVTFPCWEKMDVIGILRLDKK